MYEQSTAEDCSQGCDFLTTEVACDNSQSCIWNDEICTSVNYTDMLPNNYYVTQVTSELTMSGDFDLDIDGDGLCEIEDGDQCEDFEDEDGDNEWDFDLDIDGDGLCEIEDGDECESYTNVSYIEIWEAPNYYIENGYCASSSPQSDWYIDQNSKCGLILENEVCTNAESIDVGYEDGTRYCPCDFGQICTASQKYISDSHMLNSLAVRPAKDYDTSFDLLLIANDDNLTYNLSSEVSVSVLINPK